MRISTVAGSSVVVIFASLLIGCSSLVGARPSPTVAPPPSSNGSGSPIASHSTPPTPTVSPSPSPSHSPAPTPIPPDRIQVSSAAQAAALVLASDPRFASVVPLNSELVGASAWYESYPEARDSGAFTVVVTLGSGDCEAGCISKHEWTYRVASDGTVKLMGDSGDNVDYQPPTPTDGLAHVTVHLTAGPVCPVERNPPDPSCAPRPVAGGEVVVHSVDGAEVARGTSTDDGTVSFDLPGGAYYAEALAVEGLMGGAPEPQAFSVVAGSSASLAVEYDTGIR